MNCKYCNRHMAPHGCPGMYVCLTCFYTNRYNPSDPNQVIQEEIYVRYINDREYHLILDYSRNKCLLYQWVERDSKTGLLRHELLNIDHMIQCSPQTVNDKIKTYLLFL